jgi:hypothetical protein
MFTTSPDHDAMTLLYEEARSSRNPSRSASAIVGWRSIERNWISRGMPIRSSSGASSLPVNERPAEFQPVLIHRPFPMVRTTGSPSTRHSIATSWSWYERGMSLLWATSTAPSEVAGGTATRSEHRPWSRPA